MCLSETQNAFLGFLTPCREGQSGAPESNNGIGFVWASRCSCTIKAGGMHLKVHWVWDAVAADLLMLVIVFAET